MKESRTGAGQARIQEQPMKVVSVHYPEDGVMAPAISKVWGQLPDSGHLRKELITHGYGSWITILPAYFVIPKVSMKLIQSVVLRINDLTCHQNPKN
jgi:hypothetical protein